MPRFCLRVTVWIRHSGCRSDGRGIRLIGIDPVRLDRLCDQAAIDLADIGQFYPQANGTPELREAIAALYDGATRDDVLVTIGAAEANEIVTLNEGTFEDLGRSSVYVVDFSSTNQNLM